MNRHRQVYLKWMKNTNDWCTSVDNLRSKEIRNENKKVEYETNAPDLIQNAIHLFTGALFWLSLLFRPQDLT